MTLAVWKPVTPKSNLQCVRKGYNKEGKIQRDWAWEWSCKQGIKNGEANIERIGQLITLIREKDQSVCLGNAFPNKSANPNNFKRQKIFLEGKGTDILYLDFDGDDARVTNDTNLLERVGYSLAMLPGLNEPEDLGLVAFYSSSAYWEEERPTRISIHCIIILDKVYPHETIKAWQEQYRGILDPATAVITQPLFVANPTFEGISPRKIAGDEIIIRPGKKLSLGDIDYKKHRNIDKTIPYEWNELLKEDNEKFKERALDLAKKGKLDGNRGHFLFSTFQKKIFHDRENIGNILKIIEDNPILYCDPKKNDRTFSQVLRTFENAKDYVDTRLLGSDIRDNKRFNIKTVYTKTLGQDEIEEYPTNNAMILVKSGCNTRKSTGIIDEYLKQGDFKSAVYVTTDKASIDSFIFKRPLWKSYLEQGEKIQDKQDWMPKQKWLASTEQSLRYALMGGKTYKPPELVIIDEAEAVGLNILNPNSYLSAHVLYAMCNSAKAVLMLDADITNDLTGYLGESLAKQSGKEPHALVNSFSWNSEKTIHMLRSERQAILTIKALLDAGERVYLHVGFADSSEKKRISRLVRFFREYLEDDNAVMGFDRNTAPKELRRNPNKTIQEWFKKGLRLLIHSPWSKRSWDYNPPEGAIEFDSNVGIYPHTFFSHANIDQQDWRMRKTRKSYLYITHERDYTPFTEFERAVDEGVIRIKNDLKDNQLLRAKKRRSDELSNVRDAYITKVKREGAEVLYDLIDDPYGEEDYIDQMIMHLLTEDGEEVLEDEIRSAWLKPKLRREILEAFYRQTEILDLDGLDGVIERPSLDKETVNYATFKDLYIRNMRINQADVKDILTVWDMTPEERDAVDTIEPANFYIAKGMLCDAVDRALENYYPYGIKQFPNILRLDRDCFQLCITDQGKSELGDVIKNEFPRLWGEIPWLNASHKKDTLKYLEAMFTFFDISFEREDEIPKKQVKRNVIEEYENKKLLGKLNGVKKGKRIGEKIHHINQVITDKIKKGRELTRCEKRWQRARGTNYYLNLEEIRSLVISNHLKRGEIIKGSFPGEIFSSSQQDLKNEKKKISGGWV